MLDTLNEDCWRHILGFVPVVDILRTESSSRQWQEIVLRYLQGVRISLCVPEEEQWLKNEKVVSPNTRTLMMSREQRESKKWAKKVGLLVVNSFCYNLETFNIMRENCPNIKCLQVDLHKIIDLETDTLHANLRKEDFKDLECLSIIAPRINADAIVSQFIGDKALKELKCLYSDITGDFLNTINTSNLKCLSFKYCSWLRPNCLRYAVHLTDLTLSYYNISDSQLTDLPLALENMPKLMSLEIKTGRRWCDTASTLNSLCTLRRLRHLYLDFAMEDRDIQAITRCCKDLQSLELTCCNELTPATVQAIIRNVGARLTRLVMMCSNGPNDDDLLLAIIRGCPELTWLKLGWLDVSLDVLPRAAAARRATRGAARARRLCLDLTYSRLAEHYYNYCEFGHHVKYGHIDLEYEDLIVILDDGNPASRKYLNNIMANNYPSYLPNKKKKIEENQN